MKRSLDFWFSYALSIAVSLGFFKRERENIKKTNVKRLDFFSSDVFFNLIFKPFFYFKIYTVTVKRAYSCKKNGNSGEAFKRRRRKS